jgi:hypothetical protein
MRRLEKKSLRGQVGTQIPSTEEAPMKTEDIITHLFVMWMTA